MKTSFLFLWHFLHPCVACVASLRLRWCLFWLSAYMQLGGYVVMASFELLRLLLVMPELWMSLLPAQCLTTVIPGGSYLPGLDISPQYSPPTPDLRRHLPLTQVTHLSSAGAIIFLPFFLISLLSILSQFVCLSITWNPLPFPLQAFLH